MCHFPSWFEKKDKSQRKELPNVVFLEDKDMNKSEDFNDHYGHGAIAKFWNISKYLYKERELFPCHPEVAKSIMNGRQNWIQKQFGIKVHVNAKGQLHGEMSQLENDTILFRKNYSNGILHGKFETWDWYGDREVVCTYHKGTLDGVYKKYYHGVYKKYYHGTLEKHMIYNRGKIVKTII